MTGTQEHWQEVFASRAATDVSWYQPRLEASLALITGAAPDPAAGIIDIGGGASTLVDSLLDLGHADVSVLDVSEAALERSQARLGARATKVHWIVADITRWTPQRQWQLWHDRAAFHFLTAAAEQDAYVAALREATAPGATVIIATFAPDGPERCSGLPVQRYSPETLAERLGGDFTLVSGRPEAHVTPKGAIQRFSYAMLRRR